MPVGTGKLKSIRILSMTILVLIAKCIGSLILVALFVAGVFKANPRTHNPERPPMAEYTAGFLSCALAVIGMYYLWFAAQ